MDDKQRQRAVATYFDSIKKPGEEIIWIGNPSPRWVKKTYLPLFIAIIVSFLGSTIFVLDYVFQMFDYKWALIIGITYPFAELLGLLLLIKLNPGYKLLKTNYAFSNKRLFIRSCVFRERLESYELNELSSLGVHTAPRDAKFGTISFTAESSKGERNFPKCLHSIEDPQGVYDKLRELTKSHVSKRP